MTIQRTTSISSWSDPELERQLLASISLDVPWRAVEHLAGLVRLSGSDEEKKAVDYLVSVLEKEELPHHLYEPECFISIPRAATLRVDEPGGKSFRVKTVSMSVSTDGQELVGELVYLPTRNQGRSEFFSAGIDQISLDVRGKIVLTEGMAGPGGVRDAMNGGAIAAIFINPGQYIHEGICTTIWGTPDLDSCVRQPTIPVVNVNNSDGQHLIDVASRGGQVALSTTLDLDWRPIPVLVAEIPGNQASDEFVLLHGHLDGWHYGVADNATGDATILELARVFWKHREHLARSLRLAWWSGHSHGRYAGSTWFADTFAIDLARNCVAQVNCDSPGARWADTYNHLTAMSETEPFIDEVIRDTTGIVPVAARPLRAGDYSFNSIGVSSFYMLSSTMSDEKRAELGYYNVGGCGGNIQWHTEDDKVEIADRDNLLRDMKMYAASVLRTLNAPIHPFDWCSTVNEFRTTLALYQNGADGVFDFEPSRTALDELESALQKFYANAPVGGTVSDPHVVRFNFVQRRLSRLLVRINYSRMPEFWHDPAVTVPPLPDLAPALTTSIARRHVHQLGLLKAHLTRGQNRLVWTLAQACELIERMMT